MAIKFSTALANSVLDNWINAGAGQSFFNNAILEIRSGSRPASPDDAPTGTILGNITIPADSHAAAAAKAVAKAGTWQDTAADAGGTASWFRVKLSGDAGTTNTTDKRFDGDCATSGSDLNLDTTTIVSGQPIVVNTFTLSLP